MDGARYRVGHVHHGQCRIRTKKTGVMLALGSMMEDIHGVIRGAAPGQSGMADKARKPDAAYIYAERVVVIVAPMFTGDLADAVYGAGLGYRILRASGFRRVFPKHGDATWPENTALPFAGNLEYIQ